MFYRMEVYCPICRCVMDGMRGYGRNANCCGSECYREWEWRKTLAIMGEPYEPQPAVLAAARARLADTADKPQGASQ